MDYATIYAHWSLSRRALDALFPGYDFPETPPQESTFHSALEGLAIANELTVQEVVETVLDKMMMLAPEPANDQQSAA